MNELIWTPQCWSETPSDVGRRGYITSDTCVRSERFACNVIGEIDIDISRVPPVIAAVADEPMTLDQLAEHGLFVAPSKMCGFWQVCELAGNRVHWTYINYKSMDEARDHATRIARGRVQ